jgi:hypothetical protein
MSHSNLPTHYSYPLLESCVEDNWEAVGQKLLLH